MLHLERLSILQSLPFQILFYRIYIFQNPQVLQFVRAVFSACSCLQNSDNAGFYALNRACALVKLSSILFSAIISRMSLSSLSRRESLLFFYLILVNPSHSVHNLKLRIRRVIFPSRIIVTDLQSVPLCRRLLKSFLIRRVSDK